MAMSPPAEREISPPQSESENSSKPEFEFESKLPVAMSPPAEREISPPGPVNEDESMPEVLMLPTTILPGG